MSNDQDVFVALSHELKNCVADLSKKLDELANIALGLTDGLTTLADLSERIRRNIEDPPAERHSLEINDGGHGSSLDNEPIQ